MQNILERVWFELWLVVLCLLWRPWYSLQAALCAATSWTRPIGPWPSPPQAALKPHWAGARMEEIALGDWLAKSFNYSDFTTGPDWLCLWLLAVSNKDGNVWPPWQTTLCLFLLFILNFKRNLRFYLSYGNCSRFHNIDRKQSGNTWERARVF